MSVVLDPIESPVDRQAPPKMVHLVDTWSDPDVALCGRRLAGPFVDGQDEDCVVCHELAKGFLS